MPMHTHSYAYAGAPPVTAGLAAWYHAASFNDSAQIWHDASGNGRDVGVSSDGGISDPVRLASLPTNSSHGYIHNGADATARIYLGDLPLNYTLFAVSWYADASARGRILTCDPVSNRNWFVGHAAGRAGVAMYEEFHLTPLVSEYYLQYNATSPLISTTQPGLYRAQGVDQTTLSSASSAMTYVGDLQLCINCWNCTAGTTMTFCAAGREQGTWAMAALLLYNRKLSLYEMAAVESYLSTTYDIPLQAQGKHKPGQCSTHIHDENKQLNVRYLLFM